MSTAAPKKAVASFFKKKGKGAEPNAEVSSIIKSSDMGVPGVSDTAGGWDDATVDPDAEYRELAALGGSMGGRVHIAVADMDAGGDDDVDEDKIRRNLEAQEARRALTLARQHTREKAAAATSAAPVAAVVTPADGGTVKWRPKSYADKAGEASSAAGGAAAGTAPNIKDERAFPTLGRAISGLPPGARIMAPEKGFGALASRNQWADLAGGEGEEEGYGGEEEAAPAAPAATAAAPAAVEVAPDLEGPAAAALVRPPPSAPLAATDADVREAVEKICVELRLSRDYSEALARLRDDIAFPPGTLAAGRAVMAEAIALAGLDCTGMGDRLALGRLLPLLIPSRLVSKEGLATAVARVCARVDVSSWSSDFPKAPLWLVDILGSGACVGGKLWHPADGAGAGGASGKAGAAAAAVPQHEPAAVAAGGYVPLTHIHSKVGAAMKFSSSVSSVAMRELGAALPPFTAALRRELEGGEEEEEAPAAPAEVAPPAAGDEDEEGLAGDKKKKKKKAKAKADEEEDE